MNEKYRIAHQKCKKGRPTSFGMQDSNLVFDELCLKAGNTFLDIGCGVGEYSIHAAKLIGDSGRVYALDKSPGLIKGLREQAAIDGINNLTAAVADITQTLPVRDHSIDVCLLATVLHIPEVTAAANSLFSEIRRVLKPDGHFSIIECSKKNLSFGPPLEMRLSADEVEEMANQFGFQKISMVDFGFNYMIKFSIK